MSVKSPFNLTGKVAVVTGGGGVLPGAMAKALAEAGAGVVLLGRTLATLEAVAGDIKANGGAALSVQADVTSLESLQAAHQQIIGWRGRLDILVNGAGGNHPSATTTADLSFFELPEEAVRFVFDLNCLGTLLPCQIFGRSMADQQSGSIINISSMAALKALTRVPIYSAAKAAITTLTTWLSVHMAQEYGPDIRVNAIAPGFFVGEQNRRLLLNEDGSLTPRGQTIIDHTPMARFGNPEDLAGATLWLASEAAKFVTGIVVPVDGGFSAFGGV